jgi:hypothetical protein
MLLVQEPNKEPNHDNKPKAHFWEPNIIACEDYPFWYSPIDRPLPSPSTVALHRPFAAPHAYSSRLLHEREKFIA